MAGTSTERLQHLLTDADWDRWRWTRAGAPAGGPGPRRGCWCWTTPGCRRRALGRWGGPAVLRALGKVANCQVVVSAEYVADVPETSTPCTGRSAPGCSCPRSGWPRGPPAAGARPRGGARADQARAGADPGRPGADPGRALRLRRRRRRLRAGPRFLAGLETRGLPYACGVKRTFGLAVARRGRAAAARPVAVPGPRAGPGARPAPLWDAETLLAAVPDEAWEAVTWREGTKGALTKEFVAVRVHRATGNPDVGTNGAASPTGGSPLPGGLAAGRAPPARPGGRPKWYFLWLPGWPLETPLARLVTLAHGRWVVEQFYEDAKGACGLADYQGRRAGTGCTATWPYPAHLQLPGHPAPLRRPAHPHPPGAAGLPPPRRRAPRAPPAPAADVSGHAPPRPPLALRRPRPLDQGYRSHPPVSHAVLSPPTK